MTTLLYPNLGAEEGDDWRAHSNRPAILTGLRLWRLLFERPTHLLGLPRDRAEDDAWPVDLGPPVRHAALEILAGEGRAFAWLASEQAERVFRDRGLTPAAPAPGIVRRVHDKAFALREARALALLPGCLTPLLHAFEPDELRHEADFLAELTGRIAAWPDWTGGRFTLKPRRGCSGRGRVAGRAAHIDTAQLRGALPRLARRGGAVLEPWLTRRVDLSTLLFVPDPTGGEPVRLLASLEQRITSSGLCIGHCGEIDSRGRVFSGSRHDEAARAAAVELALRARDAGFFGVCGVDAFSFDAPAAGDPAASEERLRPIVELNARFTLGFVALGLLRRALPRVRQRIGLEPGVRRAFLFALDRPHAWPDWAPALERLGPGSALIELGAAGATHSAPDDAPLQPALLFARELAELRALADTAGPRRDAPDRASA